MASVRKTLSRITLALTGSMLLVTPAMGQSAQPSASAGTHSIAAVVNDDIITSHDLRQRVLFMLATTGVERNEESLRRIQNQALRNLVDEHLQMQEAERFELSIADEEVNQSVAQMIGRNGLDPQEVVQRLSQVGVSIETLRDQVRSEIAWQRIVNGLFGQRIRISDTVIEETLDRITSTADEPSFRLAEIYIESTPDIGGADGALEGARAMIAQLAEGAPFPLLAQQFSSSPSAAAGGDLGWVKVGDVRPEIGAVLPELDDSEVSEPIVVPGGVYVIAMLGRRVSESEIIYRLSQLRVDGDDFETGSAKLEELRSEIVNCDALDDLADANDGVSSASMGELRSSELQDEMLGYLNEVEAGEMSAPIQGPGSTVGLVVCERELTGSEIPTRNEIEDRLRDTRLAQASRRHLRDLRRKATISVRG